MTLRGSGNVSYLDYSDDSSQDGANALFPDVFAWKGEESVGSEKDLFRRTDTNDDSISVEVDDTSEVEPIFRTGYDEKAYHEDQISDTHDVLVYPSLGSDEDMGLNQAILDQVGQIVNLNQNDTNDRYKYLRLYQQLNDDKLPNDINLDELDDYQKYIKQTELNNLILSKISTKQNNLLPTNVLTSSDYVGNFDSEMRRHKIVKPKPSWVDLWKFNRKGESISDISELRWDNIDNSVPYTQSVDYSTNSRKNFTVTYGDSKPKKVYLQRKLKVRHLQMISFGGTLGVGLLLNSGKAINIAGGLGATLAFVITGIIVLATVVSFCEMVTFVSVVDGVSGLSSRFVEDAFGFAVGWLYFLSFAVGLAGEIVAGVIMLSYYPSLEITQNRGSVVGFVTLFISMTVICNLVDIRVFGEIEYVSSFTKLFGLFVLLVMMIVLNVGGMNNDYLGFKFWQHSQSNFDHNMIFGLFRHTFNLHDNGVNTGGIGGDTGRFLSLLVAILVTSYAYSGTEIVCIAACEAKNPRKALPSATKRVFWKIFVFYCLSVFMVSLNIYAGDPRLLRYYDDSVLLNATPQTKFAIEYVGGDNCVTTQKLFAGMGNGAQSPWIIALQSVNLCTALAVINGFLVFAAISCGNAQLYVSSRTVYSLALQSKAPKILTRCNRYGIPYVAVLFSACFGLFAFIGVSERATSVFENLTSIISSSGIMVWFAMNLSFVRFFYGLEKRPDIINRDDELYPYRSLFQPYTAFVGLIGSGSIIFCMGWVVFLKGEWNSWFFFSSYGTLIGFVVLYVAYKVIKGSRIRSLEQLDYDSGRTEMDRVLWELGRTYNGRNVKDIAHKIASFLA